MRFAIATSSGTIWLNPNPTTFRDAASNLHAFSNEGRSRQRYRKMLGAVEYSTAPRLRECYGWKSISGRELCTMPSILHPPEHLVFNFAFQAQSAITDGIPLPDDRVRMENKEASAPGSDSNHAELQDLNLKRSHSGAFASDNMSSNSYLLLPRPVNPEQPLPPVSDGPSPSESQEFKAKSQIVAHSNAFSEKDDDWLFDHTKIILRIGNDYFAASSQQRESQLKNLDHSSLDLTLIPRHHYCPEFKLGISKAPETLSLNDVYLEQPSLISWDAKDPNPTSIADLVLREAEICETLKKHPHPNIVRYFGCLGEDDKIVGLVLGKYTSKLSDKVADSTPDQRVKLYEGVERGVRHLHQIGLIHNDLNPANIMLDGDIPVIIDFGSCRLRGEKMGDKRGTFGWELEEVELAAPENDFYSLEKSKEYIVHNC
ncbi:hypothetical protein FPANT_12841 [Fusarium pseudoanthophilum]|uniref:Protein kinase domain-containing protein n=1 Tax=Fusarium pseudoanthophilum TaxID=48495 RepID=A0A8H5KEE6_9HYPO|nr:hypothetical protein FPANT_12841 [Fusarium pseudoanthophilum]